MITRIKNRLGQFRKKEDGSAILMEFVVMVPLLFGVFFMSIEMGVYSYRQVQLDRSLEVTTREIRLNTGTQFTHDTIKDLICENSGGLTDCASSLRLEMITVDPRQFAGLPATADCVDTSQTASPVRGWNLGDQHELMVLRACYRFSPVFPTTGLGFSLAKDGSGKAAMTTTSAFVQEPS